MMKRILILAGLILAVPAFAQDGDRVADLEKRVRDLEERISRIEKTVQPSDKAMAQQAKARQRMQKDSTVYSAEELREIESLYQVANKGWRSQEGKDSLKKLVEKYGYANRTGCAILYLGQMSEGKEREEYLKRAVDTFSDCYYGDGVQVGAYARFYLAIYYGENGQEDKARKLFKEIREKYPDAVDHKGRALSDSIKD